MCVVIGQRAFHVVGQADGKSQSRFYDGRETASESIFARPAMVVVSRRILFKPAFKATVVLIAVKLLYAPVDGSHAGAVDH